MSNQNSMSMATSREDIIANVLHILSSSTSISPLLCRCEQRESVDDVVDGERGAHNVSWDPFVSLSKPKPMPMAGFGCDGRVVPVTHSKFLYNWLHEFIPTIRCNQNANMTDIRNAFVDSSRMVKLLKKKNKPTDDELWQAGLQLIQTQLYPHDTHSRITKNNLDSIPPHVLLQTVMDSYYGNDTDLELGNLSGIDEVPGKSRMYFLPTSVSMFFLRTFLISHALERAYKSIRVSQAKSQPIRWKRLKSMVDDARALCRLMTFDYAGKAIGEYVYGRVPRKVNLFQPDPLQQVPNALLFYPVEPTHVVSVATWSYTNLVLPASHSLLGELLKNESFGTVSGTQYRGKILESCHETFSMLTTLLALDIGVVVQDYTTPSCCVRWALHCIESKSTSEFYDLVTSETEHYNSIDNGKKSSDREGRTYLPWNGTIDDRPSGLSLCDHFLLYPMTRKIYEESVEVSDTTFYDELGVAYMAYWKLRAQAEATFDTVDPLPSPYSSTHRWALFLPQITTFLMWIRSSSTMAKMEELELLSRTENAYLVGICGKLASFGFDFLHTMITTTAAVRPTPDRISHCVQELSMTLVELLAHVVRLSGYEPPVELYVTRIYSSSDVMDMARSMIQLHQPEIQIQAIAMSCAFIEDTEFKPLLPRLIDFLRKIIKDIIENVELYSGSTLALADITIMQKISAFLDTSVNDACALADNLNSSNVDELISTSEKYAATFAMMRLEQIWLERTSGMALDDKLDVVGTLGEQLALIIEWMNESMRKLESFYKKINVLINVWGQSEAPPEDWHMLFLLQQSLNDLYDNM